MTFKDAGGLEFLGTQKILNSDDQGELSYEFPLGLGQFGGEAVDSMCITQVKKKQCTEDAKESLPPKSVCRRGFGTPPTRWCESVTSLNKNYGR